MAEVPRSGSSAVAIIETTDQYILEGRPDIPGKLSNSGMLGLFGGHIEADQTPEETIRTELEQELGLIITGTIKILYAGTFQSQDKNGNNVLRDISVFGVTIDDPKVLSMKIPGKIVLVEKTADSIELNRASMTKFTYYALCRAMRDKSPD